MGGQGLINTYLSSLRLESVWERWCWLASLSRAITLTSAQHIAYFYTHNRIVFSPTAAVNYYGSLVENGRPPTAYAVAHLTFSPCEAVIPETGKTDVDFTGEATVLTWHAKKTSAVRP